MEEFQYGSYCGLYCGACEIMKAYQKELASSVQARWQDLPERFRKNIREAEMVCLGCKTDTVFEGCRGCSIRTCAKEKNVESCILCIDYPCQLVKDRQDHMAKARTILPHTRVMFKNLDVIREKGMDGWLKEREHDWKCPQCGTGFSWYQELCEKCGRELISLKEHNKF